jgi:hypothetical protein
MSIIESINKNNLIFISTQPDIAYFHWQVELYLYQFSKHGIKDNCYALFGYENEPSKEALEIAKKYKNIYFYKDERTNKSYSVSIRFHLLYKFLQDYPHLGKNLFYHDSDIFFVKLPRFDLFLNDDIIYLSDTISYIGYNYITYSSNEYRKVYPELPEHDLFYKMCDILEIDPNLVKENENNSGGAQYLLKNIDYKFWEMCSIYCDKLYAFFNEYDEKYPIKNKIQKWTSEMWVILWCCWKNNKKTVVHKELDFSWATDNLIAYHNKNIFHLAGIEDSNKSDKFFKGEYYYNNVFTEYCNNKHIFDHINKNNATYEYIKIIKEYVDNNDSLVPIKINKFEIISSDYANIYIKDETKTCCGKYIWRSIDNKYIIFHDKSNWILTYTCFENEIGTGCGGIGSNRGINPYDDNWNFICDIII